MYLTIIKNGEVIDHRDYGITCLSFSSDSVDAQNQYESVEGRHGLIPLSTTFGGRTLRASFYAQSDDHLAYQLQRNKIYSLFASESEMYLIDSRQPDRRWKAKVSNSFKIDNANFRVGKFEVEFLSSSPYAESVNTTLEQTFAQISGGKEQRYKQTVSNFEILNDGEVKIEPRTLPLLIKFTGASTNLKIKNLTTDDEWQYTGVTLASDVIELDGIRATKNGLSIFRGTNRKLITLASGWNEFELTGATVPFEIIFDFRFYTI